MKKLILLCLVSVSLQGCAVKPYIGEIRESMVKVVGNSYTERGAIDAEAVRGCALYDRVPEVLSYQKFSAINDFGFPETRTAYLYACIIREDAKKRVAR